MLQPTKDISSICEVMKYLGAAQETIAKAEYQLAKINLVDWNNKLDTDSFWKEVLQFKDTSGSNPFEDISKCAISALILPHSNADIERVFSSMNYIKSKLRNKIKLDLLNAILMVKFSLLRLQKCCDSYKLPSNVLIDIGTMAAYTTCTKDIEVSSQPEEDTTYIFLDYFLDVFQENLDVFRCFSCHFWM